MIAGLSLSSTTGSSITITGTPTAAVSGGAVQVSVVDTADSSDRQDMFLTINVVKHDQAITNFSMASTAVQGAQVTLTATAGASGNPVTFGVNNHEFPSACGLFPGNVLIFLYYGSCQVTANEAGTSYYNSPPQQAFEVSVLFSQAITFTTAPPSNASITTAPYTVRASGGGS